MASPPGPGMSASPFAEIDPAPLARAVARLVESPTDLVDLFLERSEEVALPGLERRPGVRLTREEGLAVRLGRGPRTWLASTDALDAAALADAVRRVARAQAAVADAPLALAAAPWPETVGWEELAELAHGVREGLRQRLVAFPLRLVVRRHRRAVQVIGATLVAAPEEERFWSLSAETPWGTRARLLTALDGAAEELASDLAALVATRLAPAPPRARLPVVLAPHAAAVFLHEAIAHGLEADLLALGGDPAAAIGCELAPAALSVVDDPAAAAEGLRRTSDDEGIPVTRRWLLRAGRVEQPLADATWAAASNRLDPGSGWRGSRHFLPTPRSRHLEVLAGDAPPSSLARRAEGGLFVTEVERGRLDPRSGEVWLELSGVARIRGGAAAEPVGRCQLRGRLGDLLSQVVAVGNDVVATGAGWCAKGGQRLPIMARASSLLLAEVEVGP